MAHNASTVSLVETKSGIRHVLVPARLGRFAVEQELNVVLFFLAHVPIALLMSRIGKIATVHALLTLAVGLWFALMDRRPQRAAYACAYIAGAEALWRSTSADVFWEFGKYATAAIILLSLYQNMRLKVHGAALLYFALLLPSVLFTMAEREYRFRGFREPLSFNMSGPLAIMLCLCFFSNLRLTAKEMHKLFLAAIGPIVGLTSLAAYSLLTAHTVRFYGESNLLASGGWGPNQVAAVLGLGAFFAFLGLLCAPGGVLLLGLLLGVMTMFVVQSAMTFSRGGLYIMTGATIAATYFLARQPSVRRRLVLVGVVLFVGLLGFLFAANQFTGGALLERFLDLDMTHREEFVADDIGIWQESPVFGVGPGLGEEVRGAEAHTEFTRLLAEHGLFGLAALLVLVFIALDHFLRASNPTQKAMVASMTAWAFLYMAVNSLRLVAPAFTLGLVAATVLPAATQRTVTWTRDLVRNRTTAS